MIRLWAMPNRPKSSLKRTTALLRSEPKERCRMGDRRLMKLLPLALMCIWNRWTTTNGGWELRLAESISICGSRWKTGACAFVYPTRARRTQYGKATTEKGNCPEPMNKLTAFRCDRSSISSLEYNVMLTDRFISDAGVLLWLEGNEHHVRQGS